MKNTHLEKVAMKKQNTLVRMMSAMMLLAITIFASSGLVSAQYESQVGADIDGKVRWVQLGADIDGVAVYDSSGRSVSLSADGSIVAIGAGGNDGTGSNSGHVRVYSTFATEDKD